MSEPGDALLSVSRETEAGLSKYCELIRRWSTRINLVASHDLNNLWDRHINDCIQLTRTLPPNQSGNLVDLGSGGGLPGIVIAVLRPDLSVHLIESDQRKAAFLRTVSRNLDINTTVVNDRILATPPIAAPLVTARALAPLTRLLEYVAHHLDPGGVALLPKGRAWKDEVRLAKTHWCFEYDAIPTTSGGAILRVSNIRKVHDET